MKIFKKTLAKVLKRWGSVLEVLRSWGLEALMSRDQCQRTNGLTMAFHSQAIFPHNTLNTEIQSMSIFTSYISDPTTIAQTTWQNRLNRIVGWLARTKVGGGVVVLRALVSETLAIQIIVPRDRMKYDVWQSHRFHLLFVYSFLFVGCAVTFRNMSELQRHIRVHTGKIVFNTRQVWTQHYPIRNAHSIDWTAPSTLNFNFLFAVFLFRSLKPEFIASFYLHGNIYTVRFVYFLHCQFT